MSQETRTVFSVSPGPDGSRHFVFLDVIGEISGGMLAPVTNARAEFPTHGNVYLDFEHWIPQAGVAGTWRVRRTRQADPGTRQAEYSVVARGQPGPLEIIACPTGVTDPDAIRELLIQGIELGYPPSSNILLQIADGSVVGPIRCDFTASGEGLSCKQESFNDPLGRWRHTSSLNPVSFFVDNHRRVFTAHTVLPEPETYLDCSRLDHASKTTLRLLRDTSPQGVEFTNKQLETLSRILSSLSIPEKLDSRIKRVRTALDKGALGRAELESFREYLLDQPSIKAELETLREETRVAERDRVSKEKAALTSSIASLKKKHDDLQVKIDTLTEGASTAEADVNSVLDKLRASVNERVSTIRKSPVELLTDLIILQPFLSPASAAAPEIEVHAFDVAREISAISSTAELQSLLVSKLMEVGLVGGSAKRLSREILAAAYAGQMTVFSGSLAYLTARACASAFAGANSFEYHVPIGLLDGKDLEHTLSTIERKTVSGADLSALILEGINRSAPEVYGNIVRNIVSRRQLIISEEPPDVVLFATLARGPSTLSVSSDQCELGPVLDTDILSLSSKPPAPMATGGSIRRIDWRAWRSELWGTVVPATTYEELERTVEGEESILWRQTVANAYRYLVALPAGVESSPLESLAVGWLIPRAASSAIPRTVIEAGVAKVISGSPSADPRIARLIKKSISSKP